MKYRVALRRTVVFEVVTFVETDNVDEVVDKAVAECSDTEQCHITEWDPCEYHEPTVIKITAEEPE